MAAICVNFMTFPKSPRIGIISCPMPYIRRRILDYLRKCPEVENCECLYMFGAEIRFCVREGRAAETINKIRMVCPMFIAEAAVRRPWIRRNFWLLWGAVFGLLHLLDTVDSLIEGSRIGSALSWGAGAVIAAISLTNYAIGMKHEKARLTYVQKRCIEEIKACFIKETAIYGKQPKIEA